MGNIASLLGLTTDYARMALEIGIQVVLGIEGQATKGSLPPPDPTRAVSTGDYPPSAGRLAAALEALSGYDYFARTRKSIEELTGRDDWDPATLNAVLRAMASMTGIGSPSPPLLAVASYAEYVLQRQPFWDELKTIFQPFATPTRIHKLVARNAGRYVGQNQADPQADDYLIITTNYDVLMETALKDAGVPHYVITVPRVSPVVQIEFSTGTQAYLGLDANKYEKLERSTRDRMTNTGFPPANFLGIQKARPMAALYKIHGCLPPPPERPTEDSVVISDEDYVWFLNQDAKGGVVPASVKTLMQGKTLLLLGYSFSDWNIRSLYKTIVEYRGLLQGSQGRDQAVMLDVNPYDTSFFQDKQIDILETSLDRFCEELEGVGP